ncbi:unnamed protein product [Scytosiphon promiscuus]
MDTYGESSDAHGRCNIGIGTARHVYGPASVHLLPCKIHHTGPAPVATYFRPRPPLTENDGRNQHGGNTDVGDDTVATTAVPALIEATNNNGIGVEASGATNAGEGGRPPAAGENAKPGALVVKEEVGCGDQDWELFDDDAAEHTARFRGRKLVGRKVKLPEGVHGVVLREQPCPDVVRDDNEDLASYWAAETCFRDVTVWGHDQPRRESTVDRGLAWLQVSNSIHDP